MAVVAIALSLLFAGKVDGVREGTLIAAFLVGFVARLMGRIIIPPSTTLRKTRY